VISDVSPKPGALDGLLVADFSSALAGPYLTMLLGDLGATIIKVESPGGDSTRAWGPPWHRGDGAYFHAANRNKRSVVLDLKRHDDRELARELASRADVLVENLRADGMSKFGLGYDEIAVVNPRLIYCSISGFGRQPGGASLAAYDLVVQSVGGLMSITGPEGGPPLKVGVALVDIVCGLHGALGVMAALAERERSGRGQHVEVDLLSSVLSALSNQAASFLLTGVVPGPLGNRHPTVAPCESFSASDGEVVIAVGNDRQYIALCSALARDDLARDSRFTTNSDRIEHRPQLLAELAQTLGGLSCADIVARVQSVGVPCGRVNDIAEAFAFASEIGLDPVWMLDGDRHVRAPFRLSATPPSAREGVPRLDEHGSELRAWLQKSPAEAAAGHSD
jgi:crotonobetainyl-CoA:carnitine CoA-transferase CaiB-like acyl-CoA transferase